MQYAPKPRKFAKEDKRNVFLSCRSVNRSRVSNLYGVLTGRDYKVFCVEGPARLKRNSEAIAMPEEIRQQFSKTIRPVQHSALAGRAADDKRSTQENSRDPAKARELLGERKTRGERDSGTLGIYVRTWTARYGQTRKKGKGNTSFLQKFMALYAEAFAKSSDDHCTGINAPAKSVFLSMPADLATAVKFAQKVQKVVGTKLHTGDYRKAGEFDKKAAGMTPSDTGSHSAARTPDMPPAGNVKADRRKKEPRYLRLSGIHRSVIKADAGIGCGSFKNDTLLTA